MTRSTSSLDVDSRSGPAPLVEPRFIHVPEFYETLGPEVVELGREVDFIADPEQELILDGTFGLDKAGRLVASEVDVIACRQNLKTGAFKLCALGWTLVDPVELVVWSAHEFPTAAEAFRDLQLWFENYDLLRRRVKRITTGAAYKAIELLAPPNWPAMLDAPRIVFKARTSGGGRGLTADRIVLDEGFALRDEHMGALIPTLSAMDESQYVIGSSSGMAGSSVLRDARDRGRKGLDDSQAYYEWSAPRKGQCARGDECDHQRTARGCALDKPELQSMANPAIGRRPGLTLESIAKERRKLPPAEFARERLGWWDDPLEEGAMFEQTHWLAGIDPDSTVVGTPTFGVAMQFGRKRAAIGLAGRNEDGRVHLEPVEVHELQGLWDVDEDEGRPGLHGVDGLVAACKRLTDEHSAELVLDGNGPAAELIPKLAAAEVNFYVAETKDVLDAAAGIVDAVESGRHAHLDDPDLNSAVEGAQKRSVQDRFAIGRKQSTFDTSPLEAVTLAAWRAGLIEPEEDPWGFYE